MHSNLQAALGGGTNNDNKLQISKNERTNEVGSTPFQLFAGETGSDLVCPRTGRSKAGSGDSKVELNALILCAIKALCLLFGVVGRTDKDCDLFKATGTTPNDSAVSPFSCDNLVSMDGKLSNTGETRGRDGLEFRLLGWRSDGACLSIRGSLGTEGKGSSSTGSCCFATIVSPRRRLETLSVTIGSSVTSRVIVGN